MTATTPDTTSDRPLGLICAIPQELNDLRAMMTSAVSEQIGNFRFDHGVIEGRSVVLAEAGIGKVNTATVTTLLISHFKAGPLVFSGVAGGLDPVLEIGDLVIATRTVQHDCGVVENQKLAPYQAGHVPFFNPTDALGYAVDGTLLAKVEKRLKTLRLPPLPDSFGSHRGAPALVYGTILAGDQYIHCDATRERLHRDFRAQAVAMEGAAMSQVAGRLGRDWLEIRALSDLAGTSSRTDFQTFVDSAARNSVAVLTHLMPIL